jgi:hypothetical protein
MGRLKERRGARAACPRALRNCLQHLPTAVREGVPPPPCAHVRQSPYSHATRTHTPPSPPQAARPVADAACAPELRFGFAQCTAAQFASYVKQELASSCSKAAAAATNVHPATGEWAVAAPEPAGDAAAPAAVPAAGAAAGEAAAPLANAEACKDSGDAYSRTAAWVRRGHY